MQRQLANQMQILIVDDQQTIREVLADILEFMDYAVIQASGGHEALGLYRQNAADIDLVILDLEMPALDGFETLNQLIAINPSVRVLLSSGHPKESAQEALQLGNVVGFLQKPYDYDRLSTLLTNFNTINRR